MNFQQAVQTCFRKYVDFTGRAARPEYWWFFLAYLLAGIVSGFIHEFLNYLVVLAFLLPLLAAGARRLHDVGRSGWFLLLGLIPLIGSLVLLYFMVQPSQPESNEYGPPAGPALPAAF
ncbi:DUF805 domain-containing protein [Variovorax sp. J22P168]|uniref:DUF805 domain-containing protein n=1 Tax=Variovorax jilinensis TaxID=3053513 RepID=UPI0025749BD5|nr:DUF805 domain-containing protein [Variovorax sp. J22P168]MDM0011358.1 DUF805 domain-containing protein [Variovorax sp. J22P168]